MKLDNYSETIGQNNTNLEDDMELYNNEEIEVCEFPKSIKYSQMYRVFCDFIV